MKPGGLKEEVLVLEGVITDLLARKAVSRGAADFAGPFAPSVADPAPQVIGLSRLADALESTGGPAGGRAGSVDTAEAAELIRRAVERLRELG
jgi:hypothetical protein